MATESPGSADLERRVRNADFEDKISSFCRSVQRACRDHHALQDAKNLVPVAELVQENLDVLNGDYQDNFLPLLVSWFSNDFFHWFTPPTCENCSQELNFTGHSRTVDSKSVEHYSCSSESCLAMSSYDFIRHNDPAILLTTRQGRCGEWANCFMLILRALDYDARIVLDVTDHVWNEVWSEARQRWIHVDPCEGVVDTPLLYEIGWSKKLEYCLAFSEFEVLDVTRRYSLDYNATKDRRRSCDEEWLRNYLNQLTNELIRYAPLEKKNTVENRRNKDEVHLTHLETQPRQAVDPKAFKGRKTGGIAWRIQRGEYKPILETGTIIKAIIPQEKPKSDSVFSLYYSCDKDRYESSSESYKKKSWSSLIYLSENLNFKYERDWKTSYVARYEGCPADRVGKLVWRFDLTELNAWNSIEIKVSCEIYSGTEIEINLLGYDKIDEDNVSNLKLKPNSMNTISRKEFAEGMKFVDLIATLRGGSLEDDVAWQKPQLFRQTRGKNSDDWALTIEIR